MNVSMTYKGFDHPAESCHKFHSAAGVFTILLKNGGIVHYTPEDAETFRQWLLENKITNIGGELKPG